MKVVLTEALHARPASLLVRVASRRAAAIVLRKGSCEADARNIIDVLSLGAAKGQEIEIEARGEDADDALREIVELVTRGFSADLAPEIGSAAVEGVAVGRAVVAMSEERAPGEPRSVADETTRARGALLRAEDELAQLALALPPREAALFEPERAIVRDAAARIEGEIAAGRSAEDAVRAVLGGRATDLIADARARLLDALAGSQGAALGKIRDAGDVDVVLVTDELTPSLVASLPARVRGIVAVDEHAGSGALHTSHAAILARGRGVPVALVPSHAASSIVDGEEVMVDTTASPARVWAGPSAELAAEGRARQRALDVAREDDSGVVAGVASRLGVELLVNVDTLRDRVPPSAQGVGLLRTELLFAARAGAPSEEEQYASLLAVARAAHGRTVTVRLFDAGGDKPLPWLPARAGERGVALLLANADVLEAQLRAVARAAATAPMRALLPMCRSAADVRDIRARAPSLQVGAMIETPEAARDAAAIVEAADFVCLGTNDLAALVLGVGRADASRALDRRVLALVSDAIGAAHARGRRVTVCGEIAADPPGARVFVGLGVDALSVATSRFAELARGLSNATREECRAAAAASLSGTS
ncbi:MAG TPA: HPr family phosphocarrier protein [Polyangiaceae bacterium]|nr:HPr family phosphocarrier protein [Polyangiaceae bacterium]